MDPRSLSAHRPHLHSPFSEFTVPSTLANLQRNALVAKQRARQIGRPVLAWAASKLPALDPMAFSGLFTTGNNDRILWSKPSERCGVLGLGSAWALTTGGPGRFRAADIGWQNLLAEAVGDAIDPENSWHGPLALAGFSFRDEGPTDARWNGFPASLITLPRVCIATLPHESWLTLAVVVDPEQESLHRAESEIVELLRRLDVISSSLDGADGSADQADLQIEEFPPATEWKAAASDAAQVVRTKALEKVVLARGLRVRIRGADAGRILQRLRTGYPDCTLFAVARHGQCFLGATPERLVRVQDQQASVMALAGSAPRGLTPEEDRLIGERLKRSTKERIEHALVVETLRAALADVAPRVVVSAVPELLKLQNVQHLHTRLVVQLPSQRRVLELVERLHPTPAVGGLPREAALAWIAEREGWDRGWYGAPFGWVNHRGEGEFAVAIRSALLRENEALLFAGCGIVADSDPEQEYAESRLKLQPMLEALRAEPSC